MHLDDLPAMAVADTLLAARFQGARGLASPRKVSSVFFSYLASQQESHS